MTSMRGFVEPLIDGRFNTYDLEVFLEVLNKTLIQYRSYPRGIVSEIQKLYGSEEFNKRLLEILFTDTGNVNTILLRYKRVALSLSLLRKALAVIGLINNSMSISCDQLIPVLVKPHKMITLYNVLALSYIHRFCHDKLYFTIIRAVKEKTPLYEANPTYLNVILFRDLYIYASILYKHELANILYGSITSDIDKYFTDRVFDPTERSIIVDSYNRVLASTLQLLRISGRSLYEWSSVKDRIGGEGYKTKYVARAVEWYIEAVNKLIATIYRTVLNTAVSLTGAINEDIANTILKGVEYNISDESIAIKTAYSTLKLLLETSLYMENAGYIEEYDKEYAPHLTSYVEKLKKILVEAIKSIGDTYRRILSVEGEPIDTLRKRLSSRTDLGEISWTLEK